MLALMAVHSVVPGYLVWALELEWCGQVGAKTFSLELLGVEGPMPRQQQDQRSQVGQAEVVR